MWGRRPGLVCVLALVAALSGGVPSAGAAEETAEISFADGAAATRTWDELAGSGTRFDVCNGTGQAIVGPRAFAAGFDFISRGRPVSIQSVLKMTAPAAIAPGDCAPFLLASKRGGAKGKATGSIGLVTAGTGIARLTLTIDDAETPVTPAQASGAVDEASLRATSAAPLLDSELTPDVLLLAEPGDGEAPLELGVGCDPKEPTEADCPVIGNLYNEAGEIIRVSINGKSTVEDGVVRLPIQISAGHWIGEYTGKLDPTGSGKDDGLVAVKLTGTDGWWCAVIAVVLGALLTIGVQFLGDRVRPWERWRIRRAQVKESYLDGEAPRHVPGHERIFASPEKVNKYLGAVNTACQRYADSVLFLDAGSDAYLKVEESLEVAEEDARKLTGPDGLAASLGALEAKLSAAKAMLEEFGVKPTPDLIGAAAAPSTDGELGVGEATKRAECAEQLDAALDAWTPLARRVLELERLAAALWAHWKTDREPRISDPDLAVLAEASAEQAALWEELLHTRDAVDAERLRTSSRIEAVHGKLAFLHSRYESDPAAEFLDVITTFVAEVPGEMPERFAANLADRAPGSAESRQWKAWGLRPGDATPAQIPAIRKRIRRIDWLLLLVGLGTASVAALTAVFFGNDYFGTTEDYLTAIFAGTAGQVFVKLAGDAFSIYRHDIRAEVPPKPPQLELVPAG